MFISWIHEINSHVADVSNLALVEGTSLDLLPSSEEGKGDGDTTSASKTNDGDTEESVESSDGSKVDTSQSHLNSGVEEEGVQGHFETLGYFAPNGVSGDTTISREAKCQCLIGTTNDTTYAQTHRDAAWEQARPQERPMMRTGRQLFDSVS